MKAVPRKQGSMGISPVFVAIPSLIADVIKPNNQRSCETELLERTPLFIQVANARVAVGRKHVDDGQRSTVSHRCRAAALTRSLG